MKLLLDTHILLWWFLDSDLLSRDAREAIENPENEIYYSVLSILEIELKYLSHPDKIDFSAEQVLSYCKASNFQRADLNEQQILLLGSLRRAETAPPHKDPFDRLLICQAITEEMLFLTHDQRIQEYNAPCIRFV